MSEFGLNEEGFLLKRLDDILVEQEENYKQAFGSNFTLDDTTPFGQLVGLQSMDFADLWELAQLAFNSFSPSKATGTLLDTIAEYNGIRRNEATRSKVLLTCSGADNTIIPLGSKVEVTDTGEIFYTTQQVTINSGSTIAPAESEKTGAISAAPGTITTVVSSIAGWNSVTNNASADLGTDIESDEEFRLRRAASVGITASNTKDALFAAVSDVSGTTDVLVLENDSDVTDGDGLTPHAFEVIVKGGSDSEIGAAIWSKKPTGIGSLGSSSVQVADRQGFLQPVKFTRPANISIIVEVEISALENFPGNGEELIKQAIVDYANGDLEGYEDRGFRSGDDVIYSELYTPINFVPGHSVNSLQISKDGDPLGTSSLSIGIRESSLFLIENITVTQA